MAKKGGMFHTMGNLVRWTIWGLAALAVIAIWLGWSNRANGPEADMAAVETPAPVEDTAEAVEEQGAETEAATEEIADDASDEVRNAVEEAVETANEAASEGADSASDTASDTADAATDALEGGPGAEEVPAAELVEPVASMADDGQSEDTVSTATEEVTTAAEGAVSEDDADLNVMPEGLSEIRIPGDDAVYALVSVFQRDDGSIEVVSSKTEGETEVSTTRLVTCAPLAVGVIAEGEGARNETPELERIPLGSAASLIAALACGAMN